MQKEYSAKTLEEAIDLACEDLGIAKEELKYQKLSENGFLGLFKSVKILVSVPEDKKNVKIEDVTVKEAAKTDEAVNNSKDSEKESSEQINIAKEIVESINEETISSNNHNKSSDFADQVAYEFVSNVLKEMGLEAEVTVKLDKVEETVYVNIAGPDMGLLIGKRGQTLDSLQYLTSLVVNRTCNDMYLKVKLDTENYRERRRQTLENLARNISGKVRRTRRPVVLEPMNPYERRLIHSALQNDKYVETHSEGEEPYRRVVVTLKKDAPRDNRHYGNRNGGKNGGRYGNSRGGNYRNNYGNKRIYPKYNDKSDDYSEDYKADYAAYLESKAAAKAAMENESK